MLLASSYCHKHGGAALTQAFFRFVAEHRDTWVVPHGQGRRQEPNGSVIEELRLKWIESIAAALRKGTSAGPDVVPAAHAIAGAAEPVGVPGPPERLCG
jgi:hypothetical protein